MTIGKSAGNGEAGWNGLRIQVEEMQGALAALEATVQSRDRELETQRATMLVLKASAARTEADTDFIDALRLLDEREAELAEAAAGAKAALAEELNDDV